MHVYLQNIIYYIIYYVIYYKYICIHSVYVYVHVDVFV